MKKARKDYRGNGIIKGLVSGWLICLSLSVLGAGIIAWLIVEGLLEERKAALVSAVPLILGNFLGATAAKRICGKDGAAISLGEGSGCLAMMLCIAFLIFDGRADNLLTTGLAITAGTVLSVMFGLKKKKGNTARKYGFRNG